MADTNLKTALRRAGLAPEEFAHIVRVDPKTVQRWVAGATTPYPRHRATVARALDLTEQELWPDLAPPGELDGDPRERDAECEVTGSWAFHTDVGRPRPSRVRLRESGRIDLLENWSGIQLTPELARVLAEQAAAGRQIRILTNSPSRRLESALRLPTRRDPLH